MTWYGRGTRHERGYGYTWERVRLQVLKRDGSLCHCAECVATGRLRPAHEVDHIKPKAQNGTDDFSNLVAINKDCHKRKSMAEQGRPLRERPTIGLDGYPVQPGRGGTGGRRA